ncbi:MAG: nucleotide exchange factor GrpE [Candidatus Anammoxibacter sp.]
MEITIIFKSFDIKFEFRIIGNLSSYDDDRRKALSNEIETKQLVVADKNLIVKTDKNEFVDWKMEMERDFKSWLGELSSPPDVVLSDETPDIYSFYEELSVLANEMRRGNRKSSESLSRFDNSVEELLNGVNDIKSRLALLESDKNKERSTDPKQLIMSLVEIAERMGRMGRAIDAPSRKGLFGFRNERKQSLENIKKGIDILVSHMESLLQKEGVERIKTVGSRFDPAKMIAVAAETIDNIPVNFVAEEISRGYMFDGNVVKFAEVKVSIEKEER